MTILLVLRTIVKEIKKPCHVYWDTGKRKETIPCLLWHTVKEKKSCLLRHTNTINMIISCFLDTQVQQKAISCLLGHTVIVKKLFLLFPLHASFRYFMNSSFIKENVL